MALPTLGMTPQRPAVSGPADLSCRSLTPDTGDCQCWSRSIACESGALSTLGSQEDGVMVRLLCRRLDSICGSILRSPFCPETWCNQSQMAAVG